MKIFPFQFIACQSLLLIFVTAAVASKSDWAEETSEDTTGATRDYYNAAGKLAWQNFMGDWCDAKDVAQGNAPFAMAHIEDNDTGRFIEWDVTHLVQEWQVGSFQNQGFFLRTTNEGGKTVFCSREHEEITQRPQLVVVSENGGNNFRAAADTFLTKSTFRGQGLSDVLSVSGSPEHTLIRFDLNSAEQSGKITKATLRLFTVKQYGSTDIGVFRCSQGHSVPASDPIPGLASGYSGDQGISENQDVIFAADFEAKNWNEQWTVAADMKVIDSIAADDLRKFEALSGNALRVKIARGSTSALNTLLKFKEHTGSEPEEVYFRYYLRFGDDWNQTVQGGKMPGFSGTYGVAGWGGRKVNGANGWSARGSFGQTIPSGNPLAGLHPIGTYCYHAEMRDTYGDVWGWHNDYRGFLESNRWYSIEQHIKLNTPGKNDGVLEAWVDGRIAFEKTDIRFRDVDKLKVEQVWMNVYHGGTIPSPYDQHLFIDNVVIARKYIGPMNRK